MIHIKRFEVNLLEENCYIVSDETHEAVIIDCGAFYNEERQAIVNYINNNRLKPIHLLSTHGHFDHNFGNDTIWRAFGLQPELAAEDENLMDIKKQTEELLGIPYDHEVAPIGRLLSKDDIISFGTHQLTILPTPGHTPGSVTFYCEAEKTAFSGDTLFRMSIGRTDFPGGSWTDMHNSLKNVLAMLPGDTTVYPGHGPVTTIDEERRYNPYMR